ncbi:MAG: TetR/AcrR family transcriptional regulator [Rickettsiales bacterium]|nr:TetR/AcrR family transcriptional regulator [Rickettsiales bacterium]
MINVSKRDRLIDSAAILFHHNGLTSTSLADIAKHADIPIGNVYYYFKTKEELALAAVSKRKEQFSAAYALLEEHIPDPRQRLIEAIYYFEKVRDEYTRFGCPIGKIISDAGSEKDNVVQTAGEVLEDFVAWAERQFRQLGHGADAKRYAVSLMAGVQGATVMAKAMRKADIISDEIARLVGWIENLPNRKIQLGKVAAKSGDAANAA